MLEINGIWYDAKNIRKMKFENERVYVYFYQEEEPLEMLANQNQFNYLVARVTSAKAMNK
jgi:hypothetical protein|nr:MAG TPA: hypothetical protein [Caudoviricetes sp.]